MNAPPREARRDYSRGRLSRPAVELPPRLRLAVLSAGVVGGLLLIVGELLPLFEITAVTAVVETRTGGEHHSWAIGVVGLAALPMAWGSVQGGSRPAMVALTALGAIALAIMLIGDLPDVRAEGVLDDFAEANADPRIGFYLQTLGAMLVLVSGASQLILTRGAPVAAPHSEWTAAADEEDEAWARETFERVRGDRD